MKLYIPTTTNHEVSEFQIKLMEKEIEALNNEYSIDEGQLDFRKVYVIETDEGAEAQIYIRNNTDVKLRLEGLPVHLTHNNAVIGITCPDFKELSEIPPKSIAPFNVQFTHEELYYPELVSKADLKIGVDMKIEETVSHKIENIPENLNYDQRTFIEDYVKKLNELRADTYDFNVVTLGKEEDRSLNIAILIRNGYENDIEVAAIPIVIYNGKNLPIYEGVFRGSRMIVKGQSAGLFNLKVPAEFIPSSEENYSEFRVEFGVHK